MNLVMRALKSVVVAALQEMNHFVYDNIFQAVDGLFGEFQVDPDPSGSLVAGSPFGLHLLDAVVGDLHSHSRLIFPDVLLDELPKAVAVELLHYSALGRLWWSLGASAGSFGQGG
jgi:hypothetical protein